MGTVLIAAAVLILCAPVLLLMWFAHREWKRADQWCIWWWTMTDKREKAEWLLAERERGAAP